MQSGVSLERRPLYFRGAALMALGLNLGATAAPVADSLPVKDQGGGVTLLQPQAR